MTATKVPLNANEALFLKPAEGPCEIHDWPTEGLAARLVTAMRERHGKGGLNACTDCLERARSGQRFIGVHFDENLRTRR